jgi:serine/threonine protein kinase
MPNIDDIVTFTRTHDYVYVRELGQGACGRTVLLRDDQIDQPFVCKKYVPYDEAQRATLFANFVREVKILQQLFHENVVRVFNYYLYPNTCAGYLLMEFIEGVDVDDFMAASPELANEVFGQAVSGFRYLEEHEILHRDIRPQNLLVRDDGVLKLIDFGFGKRIEAAEDYDKSVSLNWWCEPPQEFASGIYDFATEVYFVGKLFERIIHDNGIDQFKHMQVLAKMCKHDPATRFSSFSEVERAMLGDPFFEIEFAYEETKTYREFADQLESHLIHVNEDAKYQTDYDRAVSALDAAYKTFMLESDVPNASTVLSCFIKGGYRYSKKGLAVWAVRNFLRMVKGLSPEKRRLVMSNLYTRLDSVQRYCPPSEDDIPF